jgi:predicted permease
MTALLQDLRFALRLFTRQPGFALIAILVLGLGIGANTTMFSLVNELVLKPRPGAGDELVQVFSKHRTEPDSFRSFSYDNFADLRARTELFAALTAHNPGMVGITEGETTRRAFIDFTTGDLFRTFDVPLAIGRTFTAEEERPGAEIPVTILSHPLWERLGSPSDVLGRILRINQRDFSVIGVAPKGFSGTTVMVTPELWLPTGVYDSMVNDFASETLTGTLRDRRHHTLIVYGRLRDGLDAETAAPGLDTISRAMESAFPAENKDQHLVIQRVSRLSISTSPIDDGPIAVVGASLLAMSGIVLLIAALNLANMQLARGSARAKEFAIRLSIGGTRAQVVRQLMTESLLLSLAGGGVALLVAMGAMRALVNGMNGLLPIVLAIDTTPDVRVFLATLVFTALGAVVSSLGPALAASRADVLPALKEQAGELPVRRGSRVPVRHVLVMGQLALSLTLLTTAGAFVRGAWVAAGVEPGFSLDRGIHAGLDTGLAGYDRPRAQAVYADVLERVRRLPAVTAASLGSTMPFGEVSESSTIQLPGPVRRSSDPDYDTAVTSAITQSVTQDYFPSLGLRLLRGRDFTAAEVTAAQAPPVAIIDEVLARHLFGAEDPIGRQLQINRGQDATPELAEVVGIAPPITHQMNDVEPGAHLYRPHAQRFRSGMILHVSTNVPDETTVLPTLRRVLRDADAQLPVVTLETGAMFRERNAMLWIVRTGARVFTIFGVVALLMASFGIYGVKAFLVSRRTREIGIRIALGASVRDVTTLVLRDGLVTTVAGLVLGLGLSFVAVRGLGHLLFDRGGFDLPIVAAAFLALTASALAANWVPARRASRVAPTVALRQ